jgi:hypothetical protein
MFDTEILPDIFEIRPADQAGLPRDLELIEPGPFLSVILSGIDRSSLSGHDQVRLLQARARQVASDQAELLADMWSVSETIVELEENKDDGVPGWDPYAIASAEIGTALHLTRRGADDQLGLAYQLRMRLPQVWQALSEGRISLAQARVLADQTSHLSEESAEKVCEIALERAPNQTTGQLRARIQRLVISADPAAAQDRYQTRLEERRIICEPTGAGTANILGLDLPAAEANAAMCWINHLAKRAKRKGDRRLIDQIRADIFLDLLNGRCQEGSGSDQSAVDIRVELTTLLDLDDKPGEIPGWGPVIADITRKLVGDADKADWRVAVEHEGQLVDVITTRRRPTQAQKRVVETRNPTCVFPGCRMPARQSDLDHENPWAVTHRTHTSGLEPLCRHHHKLKHRGWKLEKHPTRPGYYNWTSPLGHSYTTGPDPP